MSLQLHRNFLLNVKWTYVHVDLGAIYLSTPHWLQSLSGHIFQGRRSIYEQIWHVLLFKYNNLTWVDDQVTNFLPLDNYLQFDMFYFLNMKKVNGYSKNIDLENIFLKTFLWEKNKFLVFLIALYIYIYIFFFFDAFFLLKLKCYVDLTFMFTKKLYVLIYHIEFNLFQSIFSKKLISFMNKFDMFYFLNIFAWLESMIESPTFYSLVFFLFLFFEKQLYNY